MTHPKNLCWMHLKSSQGEKGTIGSVKSGWDIIYQASINEYII